MKTILLIESDQVQLEFLDYELRSDGYKVLLAETPEEAIAVAAESNPDVAVLEVNLDSPGEIELIDRLVALHPHMPLILRTARAAYNENYVAWPSNCILCKSQKLDDLMDCIRHQLKYYSSAEETAPTAPSIWPLPHPEVAFRRRPTRA